MVVDNQYVERVDLGDIAVALDTALVGRGIGLLDAGEVGMDLVFRHYNPF